MKLSSLLQSGRTPTIIGFDDGPFLKQKGASVPVCGVVCSGTRFDGMVWGQTTHDGLDAGQVIVQLLQQSKFASQVHAVLLDGITMGGMNIIDLPYVYSQLQVPVVAVMRKAPNLQKFIGVANRLPHPEERNRRIKAAGVIHQQKCAVFQVVGEEADTIATLLSRVTDTGKVPECLRLAHLITSAVVTGVSGKRA